MLWFQICKIDTIAHHDFCYRIKNSVTRPELSYSSERVFNYNKRRRLSRRHYLLETQSLLLSLDGFLADQYVHLIYNEQEVSIPAIIKGAIK